MAHGSWQRRDSRQSGVSSRKYVGLASPIQAVIIHRKGAEPRSFFLSADLRGIGSPCGIPHRGFRLTAEIPRGRDDGKQKADPPEAEHTPSSFTIRTMLHSLRVIQKLRSRSLVKA